MPAALFPNGGGSRAASGESSSAASAQPSSQQQPAVITRGLVRNYSSFRSQLPVLKGFDMTAERGQIYALLGPSGSGKSTLVKLLMGRLSIHGGSCTVLGATPGTQGHPVPGSAIGYMPQDLALYGEFTTMETLRYFAMLNGMNDKQLNERADFLLRFLDMVHLKHRLVNAMSGGQQRRVSLAAALLHQPKLLLLDEPTVGVSSVLRARIWSHLLELVKTTDTTVIITTHYIDEARQADRVGMMGDGRLLVEDTPANLLRQYQRDSLEDVFLRVCQEAESSEEIADHVASLHEEQEESIAQHGGDPERAHRINSNDDDAKTPLLGASGARSDSKKVRSLVPTEAQARKDGICSRIGQGVKEYFYSFVRDARWAKPRNVKAMLWKNFTRLRRNYLLLLFQFLLPAVQIILFCTAIGPNPEGLHMAIVNHDAPGGFGDLYLSYLDSSTITQVPVASHDLGVAGVRAGDYWGVIDIGSNFTDDLILRFVNQTTVTPDIIIGSSINVTMDMTNQQVAIILEQKITEAFQTLVHTLLTLSGLDPELGDLPVRIMPPIYGEVNPRFTDFILPAMIINIAFAMSIGLTAMSFVLEKKEGLLDRTWAAGVSPGEVLIGHTLIQFCVLVVQLGLLLLFSLVVFSAPMEGSFILVLILSLLLGLAGMAFGLLISSVSKDEATAVQLALSSFYPVLLLSGVLWPVEAIPTGLNYISFILPTRWASDAMRSLMSRGWSLDHVDVWAGFVATIVCIVVLMILALRGISSRD
ncbi:hypothetical protein CAOG_04710 [Capsaspora owczarzaki ATCC 30864]|uniref:Uncharacterized protein n=1 Tax=Capsaspora owczarzaki (strain ATCC 30864) TaxID=595528 RepID=A0A0D2WRS2_CAPO3|nr:hypothetical protein CAOG_04710 [Capsaspora owczarzaki ATCC 30864]KJE94008.1 hypothetical protein CAOG_004710 [Capsaspora owczarzaki ATCC 30864]|eukprot:XP_004347457.1 hypothetical protein CAOG_04710 [Capsaspora owczarzaki ATCC 30864]